MLQFYDVSMDQISIVCLATTLHTYESSEIACLYIWAVSDVFLVSKILIYIT